MSKKAATVIIVLLFAFSPLAKADEIYFRFAVKERKELDQITRITSIDNFRNDTVYAIGTPTQVEKIKSIGYEIEIMPNPNKLGADIKMAQSTRDMAAWDSYPTYTAYVQMMQDFQTNYPSICRTVNIGSSVLGRDLLYVKISDNVDSQEAEPEVMYTGTMHGDETTGYILLLRLIDSILTAYGTDPQITDMVNGMEIWINPLANPDGTYHGGNNTVSGAIRYNANSADLNRNFPDPGHGAHPDGNVWQPETIAMMNVAAQQNWIISANFHGGAEVVNYPWDNWVRRHPDDAWYQGVCHQYAESCQAHAPAGYMNDLNDGITDGYDWYPVYGGRQDFMNYWQGCREVTIELSSVKLLSASLLPAHWGYNRVSFFQWLRQVNYGIHGLVTDSSTGLPVFATISVIGHDADSSEVYTDPDVGDYYRMIVPGTYSLRYSSPGYTTKTVNNVTVNSLSATIVDVQLAPLTSLPSLEYVSNNAGRVDPGDNILFNVTVVNNGGGSATNSVAILSTYDSYVTVANDSSGFSTISALGGTGATGSQFEFQVAANCPKYHQVDFSLHITANGGYNDTLVFSLLVGQDIEDFETSHFTDYNWVMGGNADWIISASNIYEGAYSAASGDIADNQASQMSVTFDDMLAGNISFARRVWSESNYDRLRFYIDDVEQGSWSGNISWSTVSYPVDSGGHTFKWSYTKDASISSGLDGGFVDMIVFPHILAGPTWVCGDVDGNGQFQGILELTFLVDLIFRGGPPPPIPQAADVDGSGGLANILDLTYMVDYVFRGGPAPACL